MTNTTIRTIATAYVVSCQVDDYLDHAIEARATDRNLRAFVADSDWMGASAEDMTDAACQDVRDAIADELSR